MQPDAKGLKFFVDECLKSGVIVDALRAALGPGDTLTVAPHGGSIRGGWPVSGSVCFTKDQRVLRERLISRRITNHALAVVLLPEANAAEQARQIVAALPPIRRGATTLNRCFVLRLEPYGRPTVLYEGGVPLKSPYTLYA